ncbi:carboxypeptidase-like regulatory domain-containing protein [Polaribacter sp. MED152]|uniref:carboxypeptidase-like regulatory domain-containing protein n=1 Tax=Polaribacter sp. MED152 TaxID=313598 RepID=UPI000068C99D|nr:carboxypeptidase-like regulatory domain-containing protein [Polaribacter sp. MED152]EAQ42293.1 hypothetical protein MED152_06225 [Polaribacter sp. MED152]
MKKAFLFYLFLLFLSGNSFSQNGEIVFQIIDKKYESPISYATIILQKLNRGTHADIDGYFRIPELYFEDESIKISSIGYNTQVLKLSNFKKNSINKIYLIPFINQLDEILIVTRKNKERQKPLSAEQIVRNAINNIPKNYPMEPHSYIGYYRDYQQPTNTNYKKVNKLKKNPNYINLHESIVQSFDQGFQTNKLIHKENQSILYKYKVNNNFLKDSLLKIPYDNKENKFSKNVSITPLGGNELNILNITNSIRNYNTQSVSFINTLNKNFTANHSFQIDSKKNMNGVYLYEISFKSIKEKTDFNHYAKGKIYISKNDFSIYKLNYNLYNLTSENPQYSLLLEYLPKGDKMFLNYMMFNNKFTVKNPDFLTLETISYNVEALKTSLFLNQLGSDKSEKSFSKNINNEAKINLIFNKPLLKNSIKPLSRNIKVYYKNKKLKTLDYNIEKSSPKTITLILKTRQLAKIGLSDEVIEKKEFTKNLRFEIKNIESKDGLIINKPINFEFYQYREFFVQEVFQNKSLPKTKSFVDKNSPLSNSTQNAMDYKDQYWLNSPLKKIN